MTGAQQDAALQALIADTSRKSVPESVLAIADAVRSEIPEGVVGVLAYGSCLRDSSPEESLVDLYVLVDRYDHVHAGRVMRLLNRLIPPNVYYAECRYKERTVRAKYAIVSLSQFERRVAPDTRNPYFWARFAQPTAVIHAADDNTRHRIEAALAQAVVTTLSHGVALIGDTSSVRQIWTTVFQHTYATELRAEDESRAALIVDANAEFYETAYGLCNHLEKGTGNGWARRRIEGKLLSVARLMKAAFTFQGGVDYLAWKIARHSGVTIEITPWQRRHPILAAIVLLPKLYSRGGVR